MKLFYRKYILTSGDIISEHVERLSYADAILDIPNGAQFLAFRREMKSYRKG